MAGSADTLKRRSQRSRFVFWWSVRSFIKSQQVTTSGTTSSTTSDNGWYNKWQRITTSDKERQWRPIFFFFFREEPTNRHPKENPLKLEDVEEDLLN